MFLVTTVAWALGVLSQPLPLYLVGGILLAYNLLFKLSQSDWAITQQGVERNIFLQILFDLVALATLLYFADLPRNPFVFYFVFHMIIAGMYLRGRLPYVVAAFATLLVVAAAVGVAGVDSPVCAGFSGGADRRAESTVCMHWRYLRRLAARCGWPCTSPRRFALRRPGEAEIRQKEKLLGIGQLVAGIAHQIANPLNGPNCLRKIGDAVPGIPRRPNTYR